MQTTLDRNNIEDISLLTPMQEGMLFHYRMEPDSTQYHQQVSISFVGAMNVDLLQKAWNFVIQKNEMLRAVYRWKGIDKPVQVILKSHQVMVQEYDLSSSVKTLAEIKQADLQKRIDIEKETLRIILCKFSENKYTMIMSNHHILYDGWSSAIIIKELISTYHALHEGTIPKLESKNKFSEYVKWISQQDRAKEKNYWEGYLAGVEQNDELFNRVNSEMKNYEYILQKDVSDQLTEFARANGLSMATVLYTAWGVLVQKLNNTHDSMFGTTTSGRNHPLAGIENMVGLFINTIPLRVQSNEAETLIQLLNKVNEAIKEREQFASTSLVEINEYARISNQSQLFNSLVVIENYPLNTADYQDGVLLISDYSAVERTNYNLTLGITLQEGVALKFQYNCFADEQMIVRIGQYFAAILSTMLIDKDSKIMDIDILSKEERDKILYEFNDTYAEYPKAKTLHQLFEEQVEKTPQNTALVFGEERITYSELNAKVNRVARLLRAKGVKPDQIVGLMAERTPEMIIGLLSILKAGGAYLPIDFEYPEERISFMLEDSGTKVLLSQSWLHENVKKDGLHEDEVGNLEAVNHANNLAYVIYTSGSTGTPKGVMVKHSSVVNLAIGQKNRFNIDQGDRILLLSSISFDAAVEQLFISLFSGAALYLIDNQTMLNPSRFNTFMRNNMITHLHGVPSFLNWADLSGLDGLQRVVGGGETFSVKLAQKLNLKAAIYNEYGPTETTVTALMYLVNPEEVNASIPIGKPIANYQAYILSFANKLAPIGVIGELYIGGEGVASGYLNRPELTQERFVSNPFIEGGKMYRTGDLARWLPDGNIQFLGRNDHQVKIRGFRIELGEVENQILKLAIVKEAVVTKVEKKLEGFEGENYLCAYFVSEAAITADELRRHLAITLPGYMMPSFFIQLDKIPLMPNGKVDIKALPDPEASKSMDYVAPRNTTENILARIWSEVLGQERIGIYENFFELGGHSLKATLIVSRIYKELNVELPLKELFAKPTIAKISESLSEAKESIYTAIKPAAAKEYYEASSAQKRMWLLQQLDQESTVYNMPGVFILDGNLDKKRLESASLALVERHESLRTMFRVANDEEFLTQRVCRSVELKVEYVENSEGSAVDQIEGMIKSFIRPFDLSQAPLLRVGLVRVSADQHLLLFDMHHIIADGISMAILAQDFMMLYNGEELEPQKIGYKDFSEWQNEYLKSEKMKEQENYWLEQFSEEIPLLNLPLDYPRPLVQSFAGASVEFELNHKLTEALNKLARETGTTLYMVLLSAINILLSKYTEQVDIIVGSPIAGRPHADLEGIIGMFVNTLVMRNYPEHSKRYIHFLKEVKEVALKAYENQDYQFEELVDKLNLRRDLGRNPLFDVMFVLQNMEATHLEIDGLQLTTYNSSQKLAKFDLTFSAVEREAGLLFDIEYCTSLFKQETIQRMMGHLQNLLVAITADRTIKIGDIDLLSAKERHQLLYEFNDTYGPYPQDKSIQQLFEEQVKKTPEHVALVFNQESMTYSELNVKANQLARILRANDVKADDIIALMVERSPLVIIGILGILKAGGAYLPIDPDYPKERIQFMLEDSGAEILLTQRGLSRQVAFAKEKIYLDQVQGDAVGGVADKENLQLVNTPKNLAYVIYTSGSTGVPKGVMVEHRNLVNLAVGQKNKYGMNEDDRVIQLHSISFDPFVEQMFMTLLSGAALYLVSHNTMLDKLEFNLFLKRNAITHLDAAPSFLEWADLSGLDHLQRVVGGGEVFSVSLAKKLNFGATIYNEYGPTETTITSLLHLVEPKEIGSSIPIGKPIMNYQAYILNNNKPAPIGVMGELYIGGVGVARGYLNRPELTAEKFVDDPFNAYNRMYRTGDLARWLPDGNIEFLGRIDHQVKIRGFRIELGEIESRLLEFKSVKEVVVLAREDNQSNKYLCAFMVAEDEVSGNELRQYLSETLPDYMIPSYFLRLEKMPLTATGKVDKNALPELEGGGTGPYVAPRNTLEEKLLQIWSEALNREEIGVYDSFFELGGHSLKAAVVISKIHRELNVALPLKELFRTPTISGISKYISAAKASAYADIKPAALKAYYDASSAQKRMWVLWQLERESVAYNMPGVMIVDGNLNKSRLQEAFSALIERHESLRTAFDVVWKEDLSEATLTSSESKTTLGHIVQRVAASVEFAVDDAEDSSDNIEEAIKNFIRPFDLTKAPLLRVKLIKCGLAEREGSGERHYLLFDMHHIIADGMSVAILEREFMALYAGEKLKAGRIQYKDFAEWQNKYLQSEPLQKQENYWLEQLSGEIPLLNLPLDYTRPTVQSFEGESLKFKLDAEMTGALKSLATTTGTTLYMVLLSAINILLFKYSGQEDIIVGSPIAGRPHVDLAGVFGMFVNTLAMRNYPTRDKTYQSFLQEVKETALQAYENQDYQFEELVEKMNLRRDISRNPLFDVMFVLQNIEGKELEIEGLKVMDYNMEQVPAKFDLTFTAWEHGEELWFSIEYGVNLFKRATIERLSCHLQNLLRTIVKKTTIKLSEIDILSVAERQQLLYDFNDTFAEYPKNKTIHQLFEEQVAKKPDHVALMFGTESMTYHELNVRSNQLARTLRAKGIKPNHLVGMMVERSFEMVIGILAILKAGGAYVPIDPEYPQDRIRFMIQDSGITILLTWSWLREKAQFNGDILVLDESELYQGLDTNLEPVNQATDLAYVLYTSGSTGNPKGVMAEHRMLVNMLYDMERKCPLLHEDVYLLKTTYTFDVSTTEIFGWFIGSGKLAILPGGAEKNPEEIWQAMIQYGVTHINFVPSMLNTFIDILKMNQINHLGKLKYLVTAGEALTVHLVKKFFANFTGPKLENVYGPTETVYTTIYPLKRNVDYSTILIGKPMANYQIYILDASDKLSPLGIPGELCVSGHGLARGYLNLPELTASKFTPNPFKPGTQMYRTGDLARWLADGNIQYLGRLDQQVKLRGIRIELDEIESRLLELGSVKETVVIASEREDGDKYLSAYIVADSEIATSELRAHLAASLPDYMIPSSFTRLEKMPLTPNGKVDKKAMPKPDETTSVEYVAPRNRTEAILAQIWKEVLGRERVGVDDNFFDLGGHSLKATVVALRVHKELNVQLPLKELFKRPTVSGLGEYLHEAKRSVYTGIEVAEAQEYYETSHTQKRIWVINQLNPNSPLHNMVGYVTLYEEVNPIVIQKIFDHLFERHEAFRTRFEKREGTVVQIIEKEKRLMVDMIDLLTLAPEAREQARSRLYEALAAKIFDLRAGPLVDVKLIKTHEKQFDLIFCMHHIISDGWSLEILKQEFFMMYEAYKNQKEPELQPLRIQYKDFAQWQNQLIESDHFLEGAKTFWKDQLSGEIPTLNLPIDYLVNDTEDRTGSAYQIALAGTIKDKLKTHAGTFHTSLFIVLITTFISFLSELTKQDDILIGIPTFGRGHDDLANVIGCFLNTTILRNKINREESFIEILKKIDQNTLEALEYQDYPLEPLVDELHIKYPQISAFFNMLNFNESATESIVDLQAEHFAKTQDVKFDLEWYVTEYLDAIQILCVYNAKMFKPETIEYIMGRYIDYVTKISENPNQLLKDYFANAKKRRLL